MSSFPLFVFIFASQKNDDLKKEVKPYQQEGSKKEQVSQMFDNIAPKYDALNRTLSLGIDKLWRKRAIKILKTYNPSKILDVATGTADVALAISSNIENSHITGVDISKEMLEYGKVKVKNQDKSERIELQQGDSENLQFEKETFDAVTVAFGVRNFENLEKGLAEMLRVTKSGGCVLILEFSRPHTFPFKQLFQFYFKNILPLIGKMGSKDPKAYKYLFESVQAFPEGKQFLEILRNLGYKNVRQEELSFGICSIYVGEK